MKTIMLLRHAQASHDGYKDVDRPLTGQGRKDARAMGKFVKGIDAIPGSMVSSPAKRAKETADLFIEAAGTGVARLSWDENLYRGGVRSYLEAIQEAPAAVDDILLVGHNPMMEETISLLCSNSESYVARMPTGGLACVEHPALEWKQVKPATARFRWMMIPSLLE